jgi:hypothetical protein
MQLGIFGNSPARSVQDRRRAAGRNFVDDHRARNISDAANLRQGVLPNFNVDCEEGLAADVLGKPKRPHGKSGMSHDSQSRHLDNCSAGRDAPGEAEFMHGCAELVIYAAVALVPHDKNARPFQNVRSLRDFAFDKLGTAFNSMCGRVVG